MTLPTIYRWIKTPCGREKYNSLKTKKGLISKVRLAWFVLFASIEDWSLKDPDQMEDSES